MGAKVEYTTPHSPDGNRFIAHKVGNTAYIVKEKEKALYSFISVCTFHDYSKHERLIEVILNELNKDNGNTTT